MIKGIGIDTTTQQEMAAVIRKIGQGALARLFTDRELADAHNEYDSARYLASRFAAKEAVFKAVAHLLDEKHFDLRIVETLNNDDGSPYININEFFRHLLDQAGVSKLHVSITMAGDFATALIIAE